MELRVRVRVLAEKSEDNISKKKTLDGQLQHRTGLERYGMIIYEIMIYHVSPGHKSTKARAMSIQKKDRSEEVKFGCVIHLVLLNALQEHDPAHAA